MASYWEIGAFAEHDVVVVGAGLVGLSAALAVRAALPSSRVTVLERGMPPAGATTRSAGFACLGSLTELLHDVDAHGLAATLALVDRRRRGLLRLRESLGDDAIGFRACGGWELLPDGGPLERLDALDAALRPVLGGPALVQDDARLVSLGFGGVRHLVSLPHEGSLDPGRVVAALLARCRAADVAVWGGADVTAVVPEGRGVAVVLPGTTLRARAVVVGTNALARELLPELEVEPGRGQVLVTAPIPDLPFRGVFHVDEGYLYFRDVDGRVLLGGGRHRFRDAEATTLRVTTPEVQAYLERVLREVVLPGRRVEVAHRWAGIMGFGPVRAPLVGEVRPGVVAAVRLGGMGIALGALVGEEAAGCVLAVLESSGGASARGSTGGSG